MKNIIGHPARGSNFFKRSREIRKIGKSIEAGNHLQIAAPRRVGKTSLLMFFKDNPPEGCYIIYADTESIKSQNGYYKRLYEEIIRNENISGNRSFIEQMSKAGNNFLKKISSVNVLNGKIEFSQSDGKTDYFQELYNFIRGIDLGGNKIVLLVDEFPLTILNLIADAGGSYNEAVSFLQSNRSLRQDPDFSSKVQFIYTGSIGLNSTVAKFDSTALINDLDSIGISPLSPGEAKIFVGDILMESGYSISDKASDHLISRVEWLIPFHFQLILKEIMELVEPEEHITAEIIDRSFEKVLEYRNNNYFNHYSSRLKSLFKNEELAFAADALSLTAGKNVVERSVLYDIAVKYGLTASYGKILESLMHDGYINNNENPEQYRFNSPILKMWWKKYECR